MAGGTGLPVAGDGDGGGLAARLVEAAPEELHALLGQIVDLATFRRQVVDVSPADRRRIVEQALVLLEQNYVHLPHKMAMHAVNPVQRLRLLRARLDGLDAQRLPSGPAFHAEMSDIFSSLRDLHTNYLLPDPYRGQLAFLPFLVEEFFERGRPRYLVTKVMQGAPSGDFGPGALVTYWNGMPIERAIEVNAARFAGSNDAARHARGVESLTIRPLRIHRYPDEDWVTITFERDGVAGEFRLPWLVAPNLPPLLAEDGRVDTARTSIGIDLDLDEAQRARKLMFAPDVAAAELAGGTRPPSPDGAEIPTGMPSVFRARRVTVHGVDYGHLRIFTFNVESPGAFVAEFVRLATELPGSGLIVDVRGNGGGHIWAAELALQTLTPATITPEPAQFINTTLNGELCRQHDQGQGGIDLGDWLPSIEQSVETGAPYSNAYPITPADLANAVGQRYLGPVVLITDARCYSATDLFCAGFRDHGIGQILGVDANTGAGGANVWTHGLLAQLVKNRGDVRSPYRALPDGVDMRVAIRRTLRVGDSTGTPVEDLGVQPDERHLMTRRDILGDNPDLLAKAGAMLRGQPVRRLDVDGTFAPDGTLNLSLATAGVDRVDVYLDGRPVRSSDVTDGSTTLSVPAAGARRLRLQGFSRGRLVANRQEMLGPLPTGESGVQHGATLVPAPAATIPAILRYLVHAEADQRSVQRGLRETFGPRLRVRKLFDMDAEPGAGSRPAPELEGFYAATAPLPGATDDERRARAFELSRDAMRRTGYDVQPDLPSGAMYPPVTTYDVDAQDPTALAAGTADLPGTEAPLWPLQNLQVPAAWARSPVRGAGILIAQPDTGITAHPELEGGIDTALQRDFLDNDNDPTDPLTRRWWWMDNPSHGTATASVVMSRDPEVIVGSAPESLLVPLRTNRSVVLVFDGDVARAVEYARQAGCHVITMSLGGVGFSPALRTAIDAAINDGLLVLAAAGNEVGFVVAPANYREVIAVAATNIQDSPWSGSSHGPAVDVSAPGESVHAARTRREPSGVVFYTSRGSGTSYAVALTAGVAALWLAFHGRDELIARYGKPNLQAVFVDLLRRTARRPAGWDASQYGAGIVDADALLAEPLPAAAPAPAVAAVPAAPQSLTAAQRLAPFLPDQSESTAEATLHALLPGVPDADLYAGELAYHLSQDPQIRAAVTAAASPGAPTDGDQRLGLARLRSAASPGLAGALATS